MVINILRCLAGIRKIETESRGAGYHTIGNKSELNRVRQGRQIYEGVFLKANLQLSKGSIVIK